MSLRDELTGLAEQMTGAVSTEEQRAALALAFAEWLHQADDGTLRALVEGEAEIQDQPFFRELSDQQQNLLLSASGHEASG